MIKKAKPSFSQLMALMMIGAGLIAIGIVFFLILRETPAAASQDDFSAIPATVNYPAPELPLQDLAGKSASLTDYRGSVVMVNLWATWCPPCKAEMPALETFYEKYKGYGFVLIGINQEETRETVAPFVKEFGLTFPIWLDEKYLAQRMFKTENLPSSFIVDRNGTVRLMWVGAISKTKLDQYVTEIIKE